jgi:hypothetical protein
LASCVMCTDNISLLYQDWIGRSSGSCLAAYGGSHDAFMFLPSSPPRTPFSARLHVFKPMLFMCSCTQQPCHAYTCAKVRCAVAPGRDFEHRSPAKCVERRKRVFVSVLPAELHAAYPCCLQVGDAQARRAAVQPLSVSSSVAQSCF